MHTIVGFIQFLLMLTQSRLMPDLHGWFETKTGTEKKYTLPVGYRSGSGEKNDVYYLVIFSEEKNKITPRVSYTIPEGLFCVTAQPKKTLPVFCERKRYLVFCQLKTEG